MKKIILVLSFLFLLTACTAKFDGEKLKLAFADFKTIEENKEKIELEYSDVSKELRKVVLNKKKNLDSQIKNESLKILSEKHTAYLKGYFDIQDKSNVKLEVYNIEKYKVEDFLPVKTSFFTFHTKAIYIQNYDLKFKYDEDELVKYFKEIETLTGMKINAIVNEKTYFINSKKVTVKDKTDFYSKLDKKEA